MDYIKKSIAEMSPGDKIESVFSVHYKKPVTEYKNGVMFEFRVADRTGQITAKYWGGADTAQVSEVHESFSRDTIVMIRGTVTEYKGLKELAIDPKENGEIKPLSEGEFDISDLISKRNDIAQLTEKFLSLKASVKNSHLAKLLDEVFSDEKFMEEFTKCPASLMLHSSEIGGLIHHTVNVAEYCQLTWEHYRQLDRDLLIAGALLHDVGKIESFKVTTNIDQTEEGMFLGHLILGMSLVQSKIERIRDFPVELKNKVLHIMLSHHGKKEWGSPVEPYLPEALTIHHADDFDAKLEYMLIRKELATTDDSWIWDTRFKRHIYLG